MELLPTPAPPSTTSLILSRSAMFADRSHPGDLEHDRENVAASGRHHPGGGRSESRPPPGNPIRSPYPSRHPRPSRFSYFVRRILIWFPAAIPDRGQERVGGGSSSRSISRDRRRSETIAFFHPTTSHVTNFPIHLPRLRCALAGTPIFLGEIAAIRPLRAIRVKTPIETWEAVLLLLIYTCQIWDFIGKIKLWDGGNLV